MPGFTPLTDAAARALRPKADRYDVPDGRVAGLVLSVLASGLKQWSLRYRTQGKRRRLILGEFGDFPKLTLSKAREAAEKHRPQIREGADPVAQRAAAKAIPVDTVGALAKDYVSKQVQVRHRRRDEEERILNVYILPEWKNRSVRGLTRRDVRALVEAIAERGAPVMANRVLAVIRRMLNFGVRRDWIDANPASLMTNPGAENARDRVLSDDELRALWALLGRFPATHEKQAPGRKRATHDADRQPFCPISPALAAVQKVRLLTAQRGGEVVAHALAGSGPQDAGVVDNPSHAGEEWPDPSRAAHVGRRDDYQGTGGRGRARTRDARLCASRRVRQGPRKEGGRRALADLRIPVPWP
jgi:hypothetical protein